MKPHLGGFIILMLVALSPLLAGQAHAQDKRLAYLVSDARIPFWDIMKQGAESKAQSLGYELVVYSAQNDAKSEIAHVVKAIGERVDGIILSPTNSSAAATLLKLAADAHIPVVISDIGTDGGEYVSYIASDNREGAYLLGKLLADTMRHKRIDKGSVGIIAIPQKRENGRARTAGFMQALDEAGIKAAGIHQQVDFSYKETYGFAKDLIRANPELHALWLQGSDRYQGALDAIADAGKKGQVLLICFDAEPEFIGMIRKGTLVGAGMQQPFLMGEEAVRAMDTHLRGNPVQRDIKLPVLAVSRDNLNALLPTIRRNVLGISNRR